MSATHITLWINDFQCAYPYVVRSLHRHSTLHHTYFSIQPVFITEKNNNELNKYIFEELNEQWNDFFVVFFSRRDREARTVFQLLLFSLDCIHMEWFLLFLYFGLPLFLIQPFQRKSNDATGERIDGNEKWCFEVNSREICLLQWIDGIWVDIRSISELNFLYW